MQGGVKKRGNAWYYIIELGRINNRRRRLMRKAGNTKEEALKTLNEILEQCNFNTKSIDNDILFSDFIDIWYHAEIVNSVDTNTKVYYKRLIESFIRPRFGFYQLKTLDSNSLQRFINKKFVNGLAKNIILDMYNILFSSLELAVRKYKYIKSNPMKKVIIPGNCIDKGDQVKLLNAYDFKKIIKYFPEGSDLYIPIQIAYNTGMRTNEVCGLTWDCVDLENKYIKVEKILFKKDKFWILQPPIKKNIYRIITIDNNLVTILKKLKKEHKLRIDKNEIKKEYVNFVCTRNDGGIITPVSTREFSKRVTYELLIDMSFQSFRHSYAVKLINSKMDLTSIQYRLGYSSFEQFLNTYNSKLKKRSKDILIRKMKSLKEIITSIEIDNSTDHIIGGKSCKEE